MIISSGKVNEKRATVWESEARAYITYLFEKYGNGNVMTFEGFEHLLGELGLGKIHLDHDLMQHRKEEGFISIHDHHNHSIENTDEEQMDYDHNHGNDHKQEFDGDHSNDTNDSHRNDREVNQNPDQNQSKKHKETQQSSGQKHEKILSNNPSAVSPNHLSQDLHVAKGSEATVTESFNTALEVNEEEDTFVARVAFHQSDVNNGKARLHYDTDLTYNKKVCTYLV